MDRAPITIAFAMVAEAGHYMGTFRLARRLREAGHRVVYLGVPDCKELVTAQGFDFVPFVAEVVPRGDAQPARGLFAGLRRRREAERFFQSYLSRIEDGPLDESLAACKADVILCDTLLWYVALRAMRAGIPVVSLSVILSLHANPRIPPFVYGIHPFDAWWSRALVRASWSWMRFTFLLKKDLGSRLFGTNRMPARMHHLTDVFKRVARRSGIRCVEGESSLAEGEPGFGAARGPIVSYWYTEVGPRLVLPELMLCPRAFQLPGCPEPRRVYLGEIVDLERVEEALAPGVLDEGKPLVLCSLGTNPAGYPHSLRFFRAVVEASRLRPSWQMVLHVANRARDVESLDAPDNLLVRARVPQLSLLREASAMVTHGGINSMLECVHFGVPMVIVPGGRDQPGNAVRGVHHEIAVTATMASITGEALVRLLEEAMSSIAVQRGLKRMQEAFDREGGMDEGIAVIEAEARPSARAR